MDFNPVGRAPAIPDGLLISDNASTDKSSGEVRKEFPSFWQADWWSG